MHAASSIYTRSQIEARLAGRPIRLRIHVPSFDAVCRMAQAGMGVGIVPEQAFELLGRPMGLVAVRLTDAWASRTLQIVMRDRRLSPPAALLVEHLRTLGGPPRPRSTVLETRTVVDASKMDRATSTA